MHTHDAAPQGKTARTDTVTASYQRRFTFGSPAGNTAAAYNRKPQYGAVSEIGVSEGNTFTPLVNVAYYRSTRQTGLSCLSTDRSAVVSRSIGRKTPIATGTSVRTATRPGTGPTPTAGAPRVPTRRSRVPTSTQSSTRCTTRNAKSTSHTRLSSSRIASRDNRARSTPGRAAVVQTSARPAGCWFQTTTMPGQESAPATTETMYSDDNHTEDGNGSNNDRIPRDAAKLEGDARRAAREDIVRRFDEAEQEVRGDRGDRPTSSLTPSGRLSVSGDADDAWITTGFAINEEDAR